MPIATIGSAIWGFLKRIPDWVLWVIAALLFLKFVDFRAERRGQKKAEDENEREALKEQHRMDQVRAEQSQENIDNATRAEETAAGVPWVRHRDELWERSPGDARILLDPTKPSGS